MQAFAAVSVLQALYVGYVFGTEIQSFAGGDSRDSTMLGYVLVLQFNIGPSQLLIPLHNDAVTPLSLPLSLSHTPTLSLADLSTCNFIYVHAAVACVGSRSSSSSCTLLRSSWAPCTRRTSRQSGQTARPGASERTEQLAHKYTLSLLRHLPEMSASVFNLSSVLHHSL